jgi:hypothetical protein
MDLANPGAVPMRNKALVPHSSIVMSALVICLILGVKKMNDEDAKKNKYRPTGIFIARQVPVDNKPDRSQEKTEAKKEKIQQEDQREWGKLVEACLADYAHVSSQLLISEQTHEFEQAKQKGFQGLTDLFVKYSNIGAKLNAINKTLKIVASKPLGNETLTNKCDEVQRISLDLYAKNSEFVDKVYIARYEFEIDALSDKKRVEFFLRGAQNQIVLAEKSNDTHMKTMASKQQEICIKALSRFSPDS